MAAYVTLAGLYSTSNDQNRSVDQNREADDVWPESLPWQPIPVHTIPKSMDHVR